jgi:NADPH-dependent ferric siderophore reductase
MTADTAQIPAYRTFAVRVARLRRLSPSFLRATFTGPDLAAFASNGLDQRIKVLLPLPGRGLLDCPTGPD